MAGLLKVLHRGEEKTIFGLRYVRPSNSNLGNVSFIVHFWSMYLYNDCYLICIQFSSREDLKLQPFVTPYFQ